MGFFADGLDEFKKQGTGGRILIAGVFVLVAGLGYYEYKHHASGISGASSPSTDTAGMPASGMLGSTPIIPPGYNALFDSQGGLIGWQPSSPPSVSSSSGNVPPPWVTSAGGQFSGQGPGGDRTGQGYRLMQTATPNFYTDPTSNDKQTSYKQMSQATKQPTQVPSTQLTPSHKVGA